MYAFLCRRAPQGAVDVMVVVARAALIILIILYSDRQFADFPYLQL